MEKLEPYVFLVGMYNNTAGTENILTFPHRIILWLSNCNHIYVSKRIKNISTQKLIINVHSRIIHSSPRADNLNVHVLIVHYIVVHAYNGVLFSFKNKWSTDTCMDGWKDVENITEVKEAHVLYDFIYMKCLEQTAL